MLTTVLLLSTLTPPEIQNVTWTGGTSKRLDPGDTFCMYFGRKDCQFCEVSKDNVREFAEENALIYYGLDRSVDEYRNNVVTTPVPFYRFVAYDYGAVRSLATEYGIFEIPRVVCARLRSDGTIKTEIEFDRYALLLGGDSLSLSH
jgi:hypothetical protein